MTAKFQLSKFHAYCKRNNETMITSFGVSLLAFGATAVSLVSNMNPDKYWGSCGEPWSALINNGLLFYCALLVLWLQVISVGSDKADKRLKIAQDESDGDGVLYEYFAVAIEGIVSQKATQVCKTWSHYSGKKVTPSAVKKLMSSEVSNSNYQLYLITQGIHAFFCQDLTGMVRPPHKPGFGVVVHLWEVCRNPLDHSSGHAYRVVGMGGRSPPDTERAINLTLLNTPGSSIQSLLQDAVVMASEFAILVLEDLEAESGKRYIPSPGEKPAQLKNSSMLLYGVRDYSGECRFVITVKVLAPEAPSLTAKRSDLYGYYMRLFGHRALIEKISVLVRVHCGHTDVG